MFIIKSPFRIPRRIAIGLARIGWVLQDVAEHTLAIKPSSYSMQESAEANAEWDSYIRHLENDFVSTHSISDALGLSTQTYRRAWFRYVNFAYGDGYRFARMLHKTRPSQQRLAVVAPRQIRAIFIQQGFPVDQTTSAILWALFKLGYVTLACLGLLRNCIKAFRDGQTPRVPSSSRPILWLGLSPSELKTQPGELNALDYVREGNLELFQKGAPLYVATPWTTQAQQVPEINAFLTSDPLRTVPSQPRSWSDLGRLVQDSLLIAVYILTRAFFEDGCWLLLAGEYIHLPRMRLWFEKVRPKALVITNSMYAGHPLWMTYTPLFDGDIVMLFYSTNCLPFHLQGQKDPLQGDPAYRYLDCTRFEVWTEGQKQWLVHLGIPETKVHVAGIIIWGRYQALRDRHSSKNSLGPRPLYIGIFDVTPMSPSFWVSRGVGEIYYDNDRMTQFLLDIVEITGEQKEAPRPDIFLKSKRSRAFSNDPAYNAVIDQLVSEDKIKIVAPSLNPIDAVSVCDLVISAPFSSPSVIASKMNIPACFYDPTQQLRDPSTSFSPEVPLISGRDQLRAWMLQHRKMLCAS